MSRLSAALTLTVIVSGVAGLYALALRGPVSPLSTEVEAPRPVPQAALLSPGEMAHAARLDKAFTRIGYQLDAVADGAAEVPPLFLASIPGDLNALDDTDTKKAVFLRVMLPLVLMVNEEIAADRRRLLEIAPHMAKNENLTKDDQAFLDDIAQRYKVEDPTMRKLLRHVDVVPPSLALAQAAEESGWGTSRLVRRNRNLFGHTDVSDEGDANGMRRFPTLHAAVRAYIHNLNTHDAYSDLRRARATARARGATADGHTLASALDSYSERGDAYVQAIRSLIRRNGLLRYDHARLGHSLPGRIASN
jgi:Bax protein